MEEMPNRLRIRFVKHEAYREIYVNGAHGGVSPNGDLHFVLHADRRPLPEAEEVTTDESGRPIEVRQVYASDDQIIREMLVGVTMSPETALSLARWLMARAEEARGGAAGLPSAH